MIIPFCKTEYQSIGIGMSAGVLSGIIAVTTGQLHIGLVIGIIMAVGLEIAMHEYREDEQYEKAKEQVSELIESTANR